MVSRRTFIAKEAEQLGLNDIAEVLRDAHVDEVNDSVNSMEHAEKLRKVLPEFLAKFRFHLTGIVLLGEEPPPSLSVSQDQYPIIFISKQKL